MISINTEFYLAIQNKINRTNLDTIENITRTNGHILSPSYQLLNQIRTITFLTYTQKLFDELFPNEPLEQTIYEMDSFYGYRQKKSVIDKLKELKKCAEIGVLFLLCFCHDKTKCHREIIKALILSYTPHQILKNIEKNKDHLILIDKKHSLDNFTLS